MIGLAALAITRSIRKKRAVIIETLRLLCSVTIVLTLWEPSIRDTITPKQSPIIAVLHDDSYSMESLDAKVPQFLTKAFDTPVVTRKQLTKALLAHPTLKELESTNHDNSKIVFIPYSQNQIKTDNSEVTSQGSNYYQAIQSTLEKYDNIKTIILLGDGDHNTGKTPSAAAQKAQLKNIPIFSIPIGSESYLPDLEVLSLSAPEYGVVKDSIQIPFTLRSSLNKDHKLSIILQDLDSGRVETKQITLSANATLNESIIWRLEEEKTYNFSLSLPTHPSEANTKNNTQEFSVTSKQENIKVLVIETLPRWEYRFIRNALSRDPGVDLDCLLLHPQLGPGNGPDYIQDFPQNMAELQKYDVIFLGDIGIGENQLTIEQCNLLKGLVEKQASGIVFIPGKQGNIHSLLQIKDEQTGELTSSLGDLIPVVLDEQHSKGIHDPIPAPLSLTANGKKSLLTMLGNSADENASIWKKLPGFNWHMPIIKVKTGAEVLAEHSIKRTLNNRRMPMLVTQSYGNGKVLFLAHDSAWKFRKGVEDLYHYRFWGQVARWMSYKRNRAAGENLRLFFSQDNPKPGDYIVIKANAFDKNGAPINSDASVKLTVTSPTGETSNLALKKEDAEWGAYYSRLKIKKSGKYTFKASTSLEPDQILETTLNALAIQLEKTGQPTNTDLLKELSLITGGKYIKVEDFPSLTSQVLATPPSIPRVISTDLRADFHKTDIPLYLLISLITLLSCFWLARKLNGTF